MEYPIFEQVSAADRTQICRWHRFLRSPENKDEILIKNHIEEIFKSLGSMTPEISKEIGWEDQFHKGGLR